MLPVEVATEIELSLLNRPPELQSIRGKMGGTGLEPVTPCL